MAIIGEKPRRPMVELMLNDLNGYIKLCCGGYADEIWRKRQMQRPPKSSLGNVNYVRRLNKLRSNCLV